MIIFNSALLLNNLEIVDGIAYNAAQQYMVQGPGLGIQNLWGSFK